MSVYNGGGLFSSYADGRRAGQQDAINYNNALNQHARDRLQNNFTAAMQPFWAQQIYDQTGIGMLNRLNTEDIYTLNQLAFPGQMAHSFMMGQAMPWLTFGNIQNQLAQQAMIQQMLYRNPSSFLALMRGANLPTGAN